MSEDAQLAWRRERAQLLATIERQQQDAARLTKRFKLLQRTLVDQQALLDRYQQALQQSGALPPSAANTSTSTAAATTTISPTKAPVEPAANGDDNGEDSAMSVAVTDTNCTKATAIDARPKAAAPDKRAGANGHASSSAAAATLGIAAPQALRQVPQDSDDVAQRSRPHKQPAHAPESAHSSSHTSTESLSLKRASEHALEKTPRDTEPTQSDRLHRASITETRGTHAVVRDDPIQAPSASTSPAKDAQPDKAASHSPRKDPDPVAEPTKPQSVAPSSGSSSWITRKSDFYRTSTAAADATRLAQSQGHESGDNDSDTVDHKPLKPDTSTRTTASVTTTTAPATMSALPVVSKKRRAPSSDFAPTWAEEKRRMQDAGLLKTRRRPLPDAKPPLRPEQHRAATDDAVHAFQYVEVVRNRDARAALPGHDCVECRKYYAALDGVLSDDDIARAKATCSRHRARFEPYNTPDDFWRLSFPDSQDHAPSP